jgi:hypothetical protein
VFEFDSASAKATRRASRKNRRRRLRPDFELLEDRCVPAIITVIGSLDGAGVFDSTNSTDTTLRGAINASASGDTIEFAAGLAPIVLTTGTELLIQKNLSILNLNASPVTIDGNGTTRVLEIGGGAAVTLSNLEVTNGNAGAAPGTRTYGGGIYTGYGSLTLNNCIITGNKAVDASGGIGQRNGNLTIQNCTIANNVAGGEGGGIGIEDNAMVLIQNSTISGNNANTSPTNNDRRGGGGIWCSDSTLRIQNSTISGNTVGSRSPLVAGYFTGGGIDFYRGSLTIESTTITRNTAATHGGGIAANASFGTATLTLRNSIVSGDSDVTGANDLYRFDLTSNGKMYIPTIDATSCLIQSPGPGPQGFINGINVANIFNTDPLLGPLANNGGPTQTRALLPGSPAINQGNSALAPFAFDQRGSPFARVVGSSVDIGAFEVQGAASLTGTLFLDYNANGVRDAIEPGLPGMTTFLDANGNGVLDPGEPSALTDAGGAYSFGNVAPGVYTLSLSVLPAHGFLYTVSVPGRTLTVSAPVTADLGVVPISQVMPLTATAADLFAPHPNPDANTAFVRGLYHAILGRDAEPAGLAAWLALLQSGATRAQVVQGIWNSLEHRTQEVDAFYLTYLRRAPDPLGLAGWVGGLMGGSTEEQVSFGFLTSPEYLLLHPDNGSFVDALYLDVLSRADTAVERVAAVSYLAGGGSRAALVQGFLTSDESHLRGVDSFYAVFLHRPDLPVERAFWLAFLASGSLSDGQVAQQFFVSAEFAVDAASAAP